MHPYDNKKCPDEAKRVTKTVVCKDCHKEVVGWTAYDRFGNIIDTGHYMEFIDGYVCDECIGDDGSMTVDTAFTKDQLN